MVRREVLESIRQALDCLIGSAGINHGINHCIMGLQYYRANRGSVKSQCHTVSQPIARKNAVTSLSPITIIIVSEVTGIFFLYNDLLEL